MQCCSIGSGLEYSNIPVVGRVKCDETLPRCQKCLDTGRNCEGPGSRQIRFVEDRSPSPNYPVLLPEINSVAPQRSDDERWAFNYFLHRAAPIFAGIIDGQFWLDLVPRLAQYHDFVWDVVVAASWVFENVKYNDLETTFDSSKTGAVLNADHRRALNWYHKALVSFRRMLDEGEQDSGFVLLSCILFAGFEFQQ